MPGSTYLYIHDKDSEKIRRHRRYAKFSPIRHIQSKFQIPYTKRCDKKISFYSEIYNYLFGFKNDFITFATSNSYLTGNEEF